MKVSKPKVEETPAETPTPKIEPTPDQPKAEPTPPVNNSISENKPKSLFEPIIISVPKTEPTKKTIEIKPEAKTQTENVALKTETKPAEIVAEAKPQDTETRPRVIVTDGLKETVAAPIIPQCKIISGQDTVSIVNNGGNQSILLRLEGETDKNEITAASSSPADVEVALEPEFGGLTNRSFFSVKSISRKTGIFTLIFESACGKKEISVKVR